MNRRGEIWLLSPSYLFQGGSPYDRDTYRYTPLLAYMVLPNVYLHPSFGKVLFSVMDIVLGYMIYRILEMREVNSSINAISTAMWVFNPLPVVVSSRGWCIYIIYTVRWIKLINFNRPTY